VNLPEASLGREVGVVDIGSNSVRLVIYEVFGAHFTPVYNEKVLAGLGRSLKKSGCLSEDGKSMTLQALKRFSRIAKARNLPPLIIGATAALRIASDAARFIGQVQRETGLDISPISGDEEARLSAMGLISMQPRAEGLAADLGGASLELVEICQTETEPAVERRQSLPLGPFDMIGDDLTQMGPEQIKKAEGAIRAYLSAHTALVEKGRNQTLYLIGGAWRNLAAIHQSYVDYPLRTLQSYKMTPTAAQKHAQWAYGNGREAILKWPGLRQRRAETLPYSGLLLDILLDVVRPHSVVISQSGLREGLVNNALPQSQRQRDPLFDGCRAFAKGSLQTENFGRPLYQFVSAIEPYLPEVFNEADDARLLQAACLMAGIGKDLHPDYRAEAIFAAVLYAPVAGLLHEERVFLALCLFRSYTTTRAVPSPDIVTALLTPAQQDVARIIGASMRLAAVATGQSSELLHAFSLTVTDNVLSLTVDDDESDLITEQLSFRLKKLASKLDMNYSIG
jgi:exopolyphosphatase/guanosine-5'-triphosphate,3'-diphosphate pyrophosphatase